MKAEQFQVPQRQSAAGIILVFSKKAYTFFRGFWGLFAYMFFANPSYEFVRYTYLALAALVVFGLIYSVLYYKRFVFYVDSTQEEFVLEEGVFSKQNLRIPFHKIQQVDLKRSLLQRVIGVYSVVIDTAGSGEKEVEIRALTETKAQQLIEVLTQAKSETILEEDSASKTEADTKDTIATESLWRYKLSFKDLCRIGLTRSYFRGFVLTAIFVSSLFNEGPQILQEYLNQSTAYLDTYYSTLIDIVLISIIGFILVFLISVIVTIGEVVLKYYGLTLWQTASHLTIEMGLKTNTKVAFQARRLQRLRVKTNPIQRRLNLFELQFSLAGSGDKLDKSKLVTPGLNTAVITDIKQFLYPDEIASAQRVYHPHKAWLWRRLNFVFILLLMAWGVDIYVSAWHGLFYLLPVSIFFLAVYCPYQYALYKRVELCISNDFLVYRHGLWAQEEELVELYKLQGVSLSQPFWYKKRELYNVKFHTAGGDIATRAMPKTVLKEMNWMLYKVESTQKAWM